MGSKTTREQREDARQAHLADQQSGSAVARMQQQDPEDVLLDEHGPGPEVSDHEADAIARGR